jgi:translocation and assembly module TamB
LKRVAALFGILVLVAIAALAQSPDEAAEDDNGFLLNLIENQLSAPGRQIRLSGVSGALSSQARVEQITISDARGPWLEIDNAEIDWSRLQLLRGRVAIQRLSAARIAWLRQAEAPPPERGLPLPKAETQPFALPELPVSIRINEIDLPSITFDESVFGQAAELSVGGSLTLEGGALDTSINVERQDEPGGRLALSASFSNSTRQLAVL